jgi:phospholipid/cholesterol/gamma-HCH transport system substrate-binding protein
MSLQGKIETRVGIFVLISLAVFGYMGFKIGAFRFDRSRYSKYTLFFNDISGLSRKAGVKIAGVKVGWVEELKLIANHEVKAEAVIMVLSEYPLHKDAHAIVRQDGLLGPKYVEVHPGDSMLGVLHGGDVLQKAGVEPVDVDDLLRQFKDIASNVREVSESFKDALAGAQGSDNLKSFVTNLENAADKFSTVSNVIERSIVRNEDNVDAFLQIGANIKTLSNRLENDVFPAFQDSIEKIATVFDRDFGRIAQRVESTTEALEEAAGQARDGLRNVSSVAEKIDEGKGLIGKLINEDETYRDLKVAVSGFKNYITKLDRMQILFDTHFETMHRPAEFYRYEDSKGYFDIRIHPNEEHFYQIQVVTSEKGYIDRTEWEQFYVEREQPDAIDYINVAKPFIPQATEPPFLASNSEYANTLPFSNQLETAFRKQELKYNRNTIRLGVQFGKIFGDIAFRVGLFDGSAGLGADIDIPFKTDKFRWVTTFEGFDFRGWNRRHDKRPHLKWLNRMFLMRNIYFTFGADDFVSKHNANAFVGIGLRFGDDDVKYVLGSISGAGNLLK